MTVREAINSAIDEEMARDPTVFIMGKCLASLAPWSLHTPLSASASPSSPTLLTSPLFSLSTTTHAVQVRKSASTRVPTR